MWGKDGILYVERGALELQHGCPKTSEWCYMIDRLIVFGSQRQNSYQVLKYSAFKWVYLSFSPLLLASLLFSAISKSSSDNYFAFLHFFVLGMVLITAICTMSQTSVHTSVGKIDIPSVKNHGLKAKGCIHLANIKLKAYWLKRANIYFPVSVGWQYFLWGSHKVEIKLWLWLQPSQSFPERWMFV